MKGLFMVQNLRSTWRIMGLSKCKVFTGVLKLFLKWSGFYHGLKGLGSWDSTTKVKAAIGVLST